MKYAGLRFLLVRFSADIDDSFDPHLSSAQQPNGLLAAGLSLSIRALRAGIEFILAENFPVRLQLTSESPVSGNENAQTHSRESGHPQV